MFSFSRSRIAARLQDVVSKRREEVGLYKEIADKLPLIDAGRLLDVGTGSGRQLKAIHDICPSLELFGLDISGAAIRVAHKNLEGMKVDLREGSIESTSYDDDFFDIVTCNASMSYWRNPISCFDEIYRILKPGGSAVLFEPQKDVNIDEVVEIINTNLADKSRLRRFAASSLHRFAFRWGHKLGLRLYSVDELEAIASRSQFANRNSIERVSLQNLPVFVRITLEKPSEGSRQN
jgi:ubiquinone/menaquinone biosynthesis C-methylase UbiE